MMKSNIKNEHLKVIADMLAYRCNTRNSKSGRINCDFEECPPLTFNCDDITPTDWLKYMQGLEVSEL